MDGVNQQYEGGVVHSHVQFAEAAANGSKTMVTRSSTTVLIGLQVEFLLDHGADIDAPGKDGTTPLCAAALWGNETMVKFLLGRGARVSARNDGTGWTALHAAAFQEHGKVVRILLEADADPFARDSEGRTPCDYASISEAIWAFFAGLSSLATSIRRSLTLARGCGKSLKPDLIEKGIIRKVENQAEDSSSSSYDPPVAEYSRPGSSYQRVQMNPLGSTKRADNTKVRPTPYRFLILVQSRDGSPRVFVDPLSPPSGNAKLPVTARRPSLNGLAL
ncbi:Aste57867_24954 [Aphanomyces stellatus]|uniref:Aste57867_24954 protein n=1 Tax=Aphanomyces stellatus TaxID=120398 RepID=A0A485LRU2_9STRA|nr:hypothetical protein As57867_024876 [Aphanomyces stellatus]VFU01585.1 Aste57867_24954 [Aphanomyces stellatus]